MEPIDWRLCRKKPLTIRLSVDVVRATKTALANRFLRFNFNAWFGGLSDNQIQADRFRLPANQ